MASLDEFAREQTILSALRHSGQVSVSGLVGQLNVSGVTVRKDLAELERRNLLRRVRGGAVSVAANDEGTFELRLWQYHHAKREIAKAAADLVQDGDVIAIDSSTTTYYLAQEIAGRRNLVVITNGLRHATLFMEQSSARVLMPGGALRRSAASLVGPMGDVLAGRGRVSKGFFGVIGVSTSLGLLDISVEESQTKQMLAQSCDEVYGLFDSSKASGFGMHSFAPPETITALYTDTDADPAVVDEWAALEVPVHLVDLTTPSTDDIDAEVPARRPQRLRAVGESPPR